MERRIIRTRFIASAVALWAAAVASGCGDAGAPRLTDGARSLDALTDAFAAAVMAQDTAAMHTLRVTEREHTELLWPEFPASRNNYSAEFAWENLDRSSVKDAARIADDHGGAPRRVVATECRRGVTEYDTFRIHGDCWVVWAAPDDGRDTVKLFGSIVEMDGRYKVVGIVED